MKKEYKNSISLLIASSVILLLIITGCNNNDLPKGEIDQNKSDTSAKVKYDPNTVDEIISKNIANFLVESYLKSDLEFLSDDDRIFQFYKIDLNKDGKDEYFVRLMGDYFCGRGGCTILLIDYYSELITRFTVMEPPIFINNEKTNDWFNLYVYSNGTNRVLKYDGKSYPSNPSIAEESVIDQNKVTKELFNDEKNLAFTYKF